MSGEIVISSTTDTADEVNRAAEAFGSEPIQPAVDPAGGEKPNADEALHTQMAGHGPSRPMVTSTTDPEAEVAKVQQELDEEREAKREEYLDPHNRRMRKRINRLTAQKYELQERVAALEAGMSRPAQQNNEQPAQPQTSEQFRQPQSNGTQSQPQQPTHDPAVQELHRRLQENQAKMPQLIAEAKQKYGENLEAELTENGEVPQIAVLHVMTLPNPIDTAWYLSRHPEIRAKLFALESSGRGPEMLTEINNVSYMLQHGGAPRRELSRSAPRPIRPLGGGPTTAGGTQDPGTMSFQDYKRWRQEGGGKR